MNLWATLILIVVGIVIGVVVWINPFKAEEIEQEKAPWFYQVTESDIDIIEVQVLNETVKFVRDEERRWQFEGLTGVTPRRERWGGMVLILTGPRTRRQLKETVDNPVQYGLANPRTKVRIKLVDGRDIKVSLGNVTTDGKHHYGQVEGFDQLFLITSTWGEVLQKLATDPPLPKWFIARNPDDLYELSIIKSEYHGGNNSWLQFKIRDNEWTVQRHGLDTKFASLKMDIWLSQGIPLLKGPNGQRVLETHIDDFTPYGIYEKSTALTLRFAGVSSRGTEYDDGIIWRIGNKLEDGSGYYARTEEGELSQPLLFIPAEWIDGIFALDENPPYLEIPMRRSDYDNLD